MSLLVVAWLVAGAVLGACRPSEPLGVVLLTMTTGAAIGMVSTSASGPFADLVTLAWSRPCFRSRGMHVLVALPDGSFATC